MVRSSSPRALIFGLITLGLNLQWGLTGLFNVGIAGFVAIGAYTSAILTTPEAADRIGGFDWPILVRLAGRRWSSPRSPPPLPALPPCG